MDNDFDCDSDLDLSDDFKLEALIFGHQAGGFLPPSPVPPVEPSSPALLPSPPCAASPPPSPPPLSVQVDYDYGQVCHDDDHDHLDGQVTVIPAHTPPDHGAAEAAEAGAGEVAEVEPPSADTAPTSTEVVEVPPSEFSDEEVLGYSVPTMGEKGTIGWCCFYSLRPDHARHLDLYRLRLIERRKGRVKWEMPAVPKLSWAVRGNGPSRRDLRQVKLAFELPRTTCARRLFRAELVRAATSETPGLSLQLGGVSLVSTTSQRTEKWYARINKHFPDEAHRAMAHNYRHQPRCDRHFENNKGAHQETLQPGEFRERELEKAVPLRVTYTP